MKARRGDSLNDILTKRFGQLLVVELIWVIDKRGKRRRKASCLCDCGSKCCINVAELENGDTRSCGCLRKSSLFSQIEDLAGQKFGKLTAIKYAGSHKRGGVSWECLCNCGKTSIVKASRLKNGMTSSCGCYQKCSGEEHWNWKNSITKEQREASKRGKIKDLKYDNWRKAVFERDEFKCVVTGKTGKINAHHLNAWNTFPDERYLTSNGVTLLKEVHNLFHKKYGRGGNTVEQFEEFKRLFFEESNSVIPSSPDMNTSPSQELARENIVQDLLGCSSCEG